MRFHEHLVSSFIPDFVEIQRKSFSTFLKKGFIKELANRNPITNKTHDLELFFYPQYYQLNRPEWSPTQAILKSKTYACKLYVPAQLTNRQTNEIKLQWVLLGNLPLMTKRGHFIINGSPRVVINQLVRSPGIYYQELIDIKKKKTYYADLISLRGAWLRLEIDKKRRVWARMKKTPKISALVFLQALGFTFEEIQTGIHFSDFLENSYIKENHPNTTEQALITLYEKSNPTFSKTHSTLTNRKFFSDRSLDPFLTSDRSSISERGLLHNSGLLPPLTSLMSGGGDLSVKKEMAESQMSITLRDKSQVTSLMGQKFLFRKFMNPRTYDLGSLGRMRLNKKLGLSISEKQLTLTRHDIFFALNYLINLKYGITSVDDIDHLKNRRVKASGELIQTQLSTGLIRLEKTIREKMKKFKKGLTISSLITTKPINGALREFFGSSPLSQYLDQTNPLAEITHKRRLSSLGPGGISRETAGMAVRGIHPTHYGRICPIETPEGRNAGLVNSLTIHAQISSHGFIKTPFYNVYQGQIQKQDSSRSDARPILLSAEQEENIKIAPSDLRPSTLNFLPKSRIPIRNASHEKEYQLVSREEVEYVALSPIQMISIATSLIPFLEHDDATRALMGSNMQRQAVPLVSPERPIVGTGLEPRVVAESGHTVQSKLEGYVSYASKKKIVIFEKNNVLLFKNTNKDSKHLLLSLLNTFALTSPPNIEDDASDTFLESVKREQLKREKGGSSASFLTSDTDKSLICKPGRMFGDVKKEMSGAGTLKPTILQDVQHTYSFPKKKDFSKINALKISCAQQIQTSHIDKSKICKSDIPFGAKQVSFFLSNIGTSPPNTTYGDVPMVKGSVNSDLSDVKCWQKTFGFVKSTKKRVLGSTKSDPKKLSFLFVPAPYISYILHPQRGCQQRCKEGDLLRTRSDTDKSPNETLRIEKYVGVKSITSDTSSFEKGASQPKIKKSEYLLQNYQRSNQDTSLAQRPAVVEGEWVQKGDLLADCTTSVSGELSLGKNILVAYMPWEGYNFEDAILINERLVYDDIYTSLHIERYEIEIRDTIFGVEQISNKITESETAHLDEKGIAKIGSWVNEGSILVGKITPIKKKSLSPHEKLLYDIVGKKIPTTRDTSLRVPKGVQGRVLNVEILETENIPPGIAFQGPGRVHIYLAEKRKIQVGDKMSGRHGNKGIVSKILSRQDMPYLLNGTPIDIVLNPLGVPSRMNVGQVFEALLGLAGLYLNQSFKIPPFDETYGPEASRSIVYSKLYEARLKSNQKWLFNPNFPGKTRVFDGRTGQCFDQSVTVGQPYILKLVHLVDDKIHARSTGPYSLVTQQPLKGRSKHGGQRLGEMEVWALEGFGAAYILNELLTIKSDDINGRHKVMNAILNDDPIHLGTPESFRVLIRELQSLCLDVDIKITSAAGKAISIDVMKLP